MVDEDGAIVAGYTRGISQQRGEIAHFFDGWLRASITPDLLISSTQYPEKDKERLRPLLSSYKQRHKPCGGAVERNDRFR